MLLVYKTPQSLLTCTNRCYEVSPSTWGRVGGWWAMESRTWWTAEPRHGWSRHRLLNRRENTRVIHLAKRFCKLNILYCVYKTFCRFPPQGGAVMNANFIGADSVCHLIKSTSAPAGILLPESTQTAPAAARFPAIAQRWNEPLNQATQLRPVIASCFCLQHPNDCWCKYASCYKVLKWNMTDKFQISESSCGEAIISPPAVPASSRETDMRHQSYT